MKTKSTLLILLFALFSFASFAQMTSTTAPAAENGSSGTNKKIVAKINFVKLMMRAPYLQGEYGFHKNFSVALGISGWRRGLPNAFINSVAENDTDVTALEAFKLGMYSITPELRFYPGKKEEHQAPHGFYLAPYMKYSRYKLKIPFDYIDPQMGAYSFEGTMKSLGIGLLMGAQWVTKSGFTFDWWILGGHTSRSTVDMKVTGDFTGYTNQDKLDTQKEIDDIFLQFPGAGNTSVEFSNSYVRATTKLGTPGIRGMGFNFGWAF